MDKILEYKDKYLYVEKITIEYTTYKVRDSNNVLLAIFDNIAMKHFFSGRVTLIDSNKIQWNFNDDKLKKISEIEIEKIFLK